MDLIGGGAKNPDAFLKFLGDEKPLVGSPFQINFPEYGKETISVVRTGSVNGYGNHSARAPPIPFNKHPRHCDDSDLLSRCACVDCPATCTALSPVRPPTDHQDTCRIASVTCYAFFAILAYLIIIAAFFLGNVFARAKSRRKRRAGLRHRGSGFSFFSEGGEYERVRLDSDEVPNESSDRVRLSRDTSTSSEGGLIGARGLGHFGEEGSSTSSAPDGFGRGIGTDVDLGSFGNVSALEASQPRKYVLNNILSRFFYKLGKFCAGKPYVTFTLAAIFIGISNLGWKYFEVETNPVGLWVAPDSVRKQEKDFFDSEFGPFYRLQQAFLMDTTAFVDLDSLAQANSSPLVGSLRPALSWERLQWMRDFEAEVRSLRSTPNGYSLQDVCFAPAGHGSPCVVQSIMGYFQDDLDGSGVNEDNWNQLLDRCADSPAECLPPFGQPLKRNIVLGGIPPSIHESEFQGSDHGGMIVDRPGRASDARAATISWILDNSMNQSRVAMAMEWEQRLLTFLLEVSGRRPGTDEYGNVAIEHPLSERRQQLGIELAFSTEISLEQEIGSSSNTDVGIVALSYLLMFLYAALTLGDFGRKGDEDESSVRTDGHDSDNELSSQHRARSGWSRRLSSIFSGGPRLEDRSGPSAGLFPRPAGSSQARSRIKARIIRMAIGSKFTLGLFGIAIVLVSVSCAVGIFSALNVKVTLIIAEVIPFMLLAVGVDNIFLLCNEMDKQDSIMPSDGSYGSGSLPRSIAPPTLSHTGGPASHSDSVEDDNAGINIGDTRELLQINSSLQMKVPASERAARALSRMGPSILLSASTQITAFLLGALVPMPAVRNFALYAAGSMFIVAVLHCTVFVAAMALDAGRAESGRIDCLPCLRPKSFVSDEIQTQRAPGHSRPRSDGSRLSRFIKVSYAPTILRPTAKKIIVAIFGGALILSSIGARRLEMGLDQRLALPATSYLRAYFDAINVFLDVGPPVYFVASEKDPSFREGQQALCGRFTTCDPFSLANTLEGERKRSEVSFLAEPASSWVDDFLQWLNPALDQCCRVRKRDPSTFCGPRDSEYICQPCFQERVPPWNITMHGLPEDEEFMMYLKHWLQSPTNEDCPLGGQAAYSTALSLVNDSDTGASKIEASHFRTFFTPLRSQADFINALEAADRISHDITTRTGVKVFAYSLFFVFFEQYTYLSTMAAQILSAAALAVFTITTVLLGSWRTGALVTLCVSSSVFGVAGMMGFWGVQFNALTLVNLSVCSAIGVEFCAHIARAFMRAPGSLPRSHPMSQKERDERAWAALSDVGNSVSRDTHSSRLELV